MQKWRAAFVYLRSSEVWASILLTLISLRRAKTGVSPGPPPTRHSQQLMPLTGSKERNSALFLLPNIAKLRLTLTLIFVLQPDWLCWGVSDGDLCQGALQSTEVPPRF